MKLAEPVSNAPFYATEEHRVKVEDICPFCLEELRRGVPEDGKCGHEELLERHPELRFRSIAK